VAEPTVTAPLVEVCVDSVGAARAAAVAGADRIELCAALETGGLTPSAGLVAACVELLPTAVLIRPRAGDFVHDADEIEVLVRDVEAAVAAGAEAVVVGPLTRDGAVDEPALRRLVDAAGGTPVGFHRAFDSVADPLRALDVLLRHGIDRLLTAGAAPTAVQGTALLAELVRRAGDPMQVIAGGGLTPASLPGLIVATAVPAVHFSATRAMPGGAPVGMPELPPRRVLDPALLAALLAAARGGAAVSPDGRRPIRRAP
jgi:copper homeostasis protein